jgi:dTDP-4-dehydrorhamnose reductase
MKRVWITGAGGLIGHHLVAAATECAPDVEARGLTRQDLDLFDFTAVGRAFLAERPAAIIHCAGLARAGDCERDPALARRLNVDVTAHLARLAEGIPFFFFSTDLVFDGARGGYVESDAVNPLNVYGATKAEAERVVLANPRHAVIRTSLNGGKSPSGNRGFNEETRLAWQAGRTLTLFIDEFRCPIPAAVTARAVWMLFRQGVSGVFHVAGGARLSRWEIGELLAARWPGVTARMLPGSLENFQGPPRSPDTSLNCLKAQAFLPFRLPGLAEWLAANPGAAF